VSTYLIEKCDKCGAGTENPVPDGNTVMVQAGTGWFWIQGKQLCPECSEPFRALFAKHFPEKPGGRVQ
jgi:hypothetical protein